MHEVYAYGVIAPSTLVEIEGGFPSEAGYAEIRAIHPSLGGEAAGGAYVLARLGIPTKLGGSRLGNDVASQRVVAMLAGAGVDCSAVATDEEIPAAEIVFSSGGQRTVFGTYGRMLADRAWAPPSRADIRASRIVCLDPFFGDASEQAARWCREDGVPYVTIDAGPDSAIARNAAALVVSEEFAVRTFDAADPHDVLDGYLRRCHGLVILTRGDRELLYGRPGAEPRRMTPYPVDARDTTGAGDSFRAGVIYGALRGESDERTVEVASAIAAIVCQTSPGVLNGPTRAELDDFLARNQPAPTPEPS